MNKTRLLTLLSVALIAINIGLLIYVFGKSDDHKRHEGPRNEIIERLHFDQDQILRYDELITKHRQDVGKKQEEMLQAKNALYLSLSSPNELSTRDSCIQIISQLQKEMEEIHYAHFEGIRNMCAPSQMNDFTRLSQDLAHLFSPAHPPKQKN